MVLSSKERYLQIAFNYDLNQVFRILPSIPQDERIMIEAGTPFIKREGLNGVYAISRATQGHVIADIKTSDGAIQEVKMFKEAGATGMTVLGTAPKETLDFFINSCKKHNVISMIDMIGIDEVLPILRKLFTPPDVVILHKGRDEEQTRGKVIPYKQVNKIRSKFNCLISAAGGIDLKEARSAVFNGANIVVANIVSPDDPWVGISSEDDVKKVAKEFLESMK
jgi:bifunctional enzyme Fae/Hps